VSAIIISTRENIWMVIYNDGLRDRIIIENTTYENQLNIRNIINTDLIF
jgi:hypothetical protein